MVIHALSKKIYGKNGHKFYYFWSIISYIYIGPNRVARGPGRVSRRAGRASKGTTKVSRGPRIAPRVLEELGEPVRTRIVSLTSLAELIEGL